MTKEIAPVSRWLAACQDTPLGAVSCVVSEAGLTNVIFSAEDAACQEMDLPQAHMPPQAVRTLLQEALGQISAYLQGELVRFDLPLDLSACSSFQQQVLAEVCLIPYGQVLTYGQIARRVGGANKVRAVGGAVAANPLPLVVPCHRVLASGGHLRGYSGRGGVRTKAWLLQLEGHFLVTEGLNEE